MTTLLLIEDNPAIAAALQHALKHLYDIDIVNSGKTGLYKTDLQEYDLILLDLVLPDMPGQIVCQQLRERGVTTPILVVSAEDTALTKIALLDCGANDYVVKPFSLGELKARIRNLLRTEQRVQQPPLYLTAGDLQINTRTRTVTRGTIEIPLRRKEYAMLECLVINQNATVTRTTLTKYAWDGGEENWTNTVDVHIKYLRDKIDRPFGTTTIKTIHGIGYKLDPLPIGTTA